MKVLLTGANGMLGQDLVPILEDEGYEVVETDVDTLDITNVDIVKEQFALIKPDIVIHCAAYTNVDKAQEDLETALLINEVGTKNIAQAAQDNDTTIVYISTDYVFDGTKDEAYIADDKTCPINNYGLSKLKGEEAVKSICSKYYIARTSWLYGHYGKNFVETMISLASREELKVVDDQTGCPTWTVELGSGILKLFDKEYGTYHICGSGETTWYGFAKEIFKLMKLKVNLVPCKTEEFPRPARRPKYSVMESGFCRNWKLALRDYIAIRP